MRASHRIAAWRPPRFYSASNLSLSIAAGNIVSLAGRVWMRSYSQDLRDPVRPAPARGDRFSAARRFECSRSCVSPCGRRGLAGRELLRGPDEPDAGDQGSP